MDPDDADRDDPPPASVPYFTVEHIGEQLPHTYLGLMIANGSSVYEAVDALEKRSLDTARREHARSAGAGSGRHSYVVAGMRITAGTSSSGQPEWVAYGTLLQLRHDSGPRHEADAR